MKKLALIVALLAVVPMANAALQYTVNGTGVAADGSNYIVAPGTVSLELTNDTSMTGLYDGGYVILKGGATLVSGSATSAMPGTWSISDLGYMADFGGNVIAINWDTPSVSAFGTGKLFGIDLNIPAGSADVLDYSAASLFSVSVPEPMTMGLLGLGGLFLARRKK